jgi:cytochrome c biogenesis protein CcdA/thiol-disulfide isomerase/thioredoxin
MSAFISPRKLILLLAFLLVLFIPAHTAAQDRSARPVVRVILFHSPTCPHCRYTLETLLPPLQVQYGAQLEVRLYDLTQLANYQVYAALHASNPNLPESIPQLYVDRYVLVGSDQIEQGLPGAIKACLAKGGCDWPFQAGQNMGVTPIPAAQPVYLAYCYDPTCAECDRVTYDLQHLQAQYPNLVIQRYNIRDDAAVIEALCERYGVPAEQRLAAPAIFIADHYLPTKDISLSRLQTLVASPDHADAPPPWEGLNVGAATGRLTERFAGFNVLAVALAGLLDGVNPCAFTTIIFFVSYLALVKRGKREVLAVGLAFTLAVFITYLALGLGLSKVVESVGAVSAIGRVIYGLTALVCIGLALVSLRDYRLIRRGQIKDIALQLPKRLKKRIHDTIRASSRLRGYVAAAFGAGVLVSIFELVCTGQVYLPTIVFMTGVAEQRAAAIAYLALYNLMFVAPLVAVFLVTYVGISSQKLAAVFQANAGAVKLLTAALFGVLGVWLAYWVLAV